MTKGLFNKLWSRSNVIDECRAEALEMMHETQEMFVFVERALHEPESERIKSRVKGMDQEVNRLNRSIRRKIYQHLAMGGREDLLSSLQLHDIAKEIERIGDYSKNIAELAEMIPGGVNWGDHEGAMRDLRRQVLEMFDLAFQTVESNDATAGRKCEEIYHLAAKFCDDTVEVVVTPGEEDGDMVDRHHLALVLMLRYTKRVAAHLRNTVMTVTNPYNRIGYRS